MPPHICNSHEPGVDWLDALEASLNERGAAAAHLMPGNLILDTHDQGRAAGVLVTSKMWRPGKVLRVKFLEGSERLNDRVMSYLAHWSEYANVLFRHSTAPDAEIRVTYSGTGSWSYIGTDALNIDPDEPTMCFGWLEESSSEAELSRVVLHEGGHALGLVHEHQNPSGGVPWDREAVYEYYSGPPNNWSRSKIERNIFGRYAESQTNYTKLDADSIMMYAIPNELTVGDYEVGWNRELSETDKRFIAEQYPFPEEPEEPPEPEEPDTDWVDAFLKNLFKKLFG